jgi:hypothetical protein
MYVHGWSRGQVYNSVDIREAMKVGCTFSNVKHAIVFTQSIQNPLSEIMSMLVNERAKMKASDPSLAQMMKLIVNSFYGKTITKSPESSYVVCNSEENF